MSSPETKAHAERQKRYVSRKKTGLTPLPSPWAWLGVQRLQQLTQQAYRTATWSSRHQGLDTAHLSVQQMRELFVETLVQDFADLVLAESVCLGNCWPQGLDAQAAPARVALLLADVAPSWRPEYPQYGPAHKGADDKVMRFTPHDPREAVSSGAASAVRVGGEV